MKAKADMNCVGKTFCAFILLTVAVAMVTMDARVSKIAGSSINLNCSNVSMVNLVAVIWKIRPRTGNHCILGYRRDLNKTNRTNCSERMDWKYSPETDSALQIRQVTLTDEGCYSCETSTSDGNFNQAYTLTVLSNSKETSITCLVSHPAWNTSQSKECPSDNGNMFLQYFAISAGLLGILFILAFIFLCKLHHGRICYKSKIPESAPTHNVQDSIEQQELEPYASYVQKENMIYNTVYEVTVSEELPPGLQSAT
nr:cell surface glycoprotein CD200 receptor 1-A-like [Chrysemys picta bellii]